MIENTIQFKDHDLLINSNKELLQNALKLISESTGPVCAQEFVEQNIVTEDNLDLLVENLQHQPNVIFSAHYEVEGEIVDLFWRRDIRQQKAQESLNEWLQSGEKILGDFVRKKEQVSKGPAPNKELIKALHDYNDTKDAAQMLVGKLAEIEGIPMKEIYG
ncbi:MAG: hypothetical protein EZS28_036042, partial [Streblomastix strix]